jgi:hypothetical protein
MQSEADSHGHGGSLVSGSSWGSSGKSNRPEVSLDRWQDGTSTTNDEKSGDSTSKLDYPLLNEHSYIETGP